MRLDRQFNQQVMILLVSLLPVFTAVTQNYQPRIASRKHTVKIQYAENTWEYNQKSPNSQFFYDETRLYFVKQQYTYPEFPNHAVARPTVFLCLSMS